MEQKKILSSSSSKKGGVVGEENKEKVKVIQWEDFEQELARLWSLSSALNEAKHKKLLLQNKLQAALQVPPRVLLYIAMHFLIFVHPLNYLLFFKYC